MERILGALVALSAAVWLCIYPVLLVTAGLVLLVLVAQGNELLEATARHDALSFKLIFHLSVGAWALAAWYCSRVLLQRRFPGRFASTVLESNDRFVIALRIWLPRLLGGVIYVALAAYLFFVARERVEGLVVLALGIVYWVFVVYRRVVLQHAPAAAERTDVLGRATKVILATSLTLTFALLGAFVVSEVELPRRLGSAAIILLAFASWILTGSIAFVLLPKAYGLPSLALVPIVLALVAGGVDNHELRQVAPNPQLARAPSLRASALEWLKQHEADFRQARREGRETYPVYVASAEGGGLRAAYWTANVLGEVELATGGRFSRHLYAISGVSGGSLGGAAFVAQLDLDCNTPEQPNVRNCARHFLKGDFLSPVVAYMLFPDLLQRFLPFMPVRAFDRARALERSWEVSWAQTHPGAFNRFALPLDEFSRSAGPRLFFNTTRVETGKRVLVSPVLLNQDEMPEVNDLLAVGGRPWMMPLSTAVHLSARFTYVSPAAKICADAAETCGFDDVWGRLVDGGYHENSGAQTAVDLLRALRSAIREFEKAQPAGRTRIEPHVVIITNDPGSARLCDPAPEPEASHAFTELLSPIATLWNTRTARGAQARRELADSAAGFRREALEKDCAADGTRARTHEFSLAPRSGVRERPPALGWFLGVGSTARMDRAICREEHMQALAALRRELGVSAPYECRPGGL
jgi:hypothetical protein